jgi:hypothetical protein
MSNGTAPVRILVIASSVSLKVETLTSTPYFSSNDFTTAGPM